jgi:uncharacterized membrane protein (UPF0127 family)
MRTNQSADIVRRGDGKALLTRARWCSSPLCRLIGLQFRRRMRPGEAIILAKEKDSTAASSIHMFFVFFPIAAVWVNGEGKVTHKALAHPWRPYYGSPEPARFVIETAPDFLERLEVGEYLDFVPCG